MSDIALIPPEKRQSRSAASWVSQLGAVAVALVALVAYADFRAFANGRMLPSRPVDIIDWTIYLFLDFFTVLVMLRARHSSQDARMRQAWLLLASGAIASATAATAEAIRNLVYQSVELPGWVHGGFFAAYLLYLAGLVSFPVAPRRRADRITLSFDIATVALSGIMVLWYWCVRTGAFDPSTTLANKLVVIAYPAADLVLLLTAAILANAAQADAARGSRLD